MENEIQQLLTRQYERTCQIQYTDSNYAFRCNIASQGMMNDSDKDALQWLSHWAYDEYWLPQKQESLFIIFDPVDGSTSVQRIDSSPETARIIRNGERCLCNDRVKFDSQCRHEIRKEGGRFVPTLCHPRLFQRQKVTVCISKSRDAASKSQDAALVGNVGENDGDDGFEHSDNHGDSFNDGDDDGDGGGDDDVDDDDDDDVMFQYAAVPGTAAHVFPHAMAPAFPDAAARAFPDAAPTIAVSNLPTNELLNVTPAQRPAIEKPAFNDSMTASQQLVGIVQHDTKSSILAYGAVLGVIDVFRGGEPGNPDWDPALQLMQIVSSVQSASRKSAISRKAAPMSSVDPATATVPRLGGRPQQSRLKGQVMEAQSGRLAQSGLPNTAKCTFCGEFNTHRSITSCPERRKHGMHIEKRDLRAFVARELAASQARPLVDGDVTDSKLLLENLPRACKWLVLHRVFLLDASARAAVADTSNIGILVTCLGDNGINLPHGASLPNSVHLLERVLATHEAVSIWIAKHGERGRQKLSSLLSTIAEEKNRVSVMPAVDTAFI
jgi:hypothetical protein